MSASNTIILEYSGPPNQEWRDGDGKTITLVAGRRYQIPVDVAEFWLRQDTGHWKRPEPPSAPRAAKE